MQEKLIELQHVTKGYRDGKRSYVKAVNDLSLTIYKGETLGLVGESGCGKSTTGNLIVRLLETDEGQILWNGTDITKFSEKEFRPYRKEIQMVFQDPYSSINPKKKIGWLMEEPLVIHHKELTKAQRLEKVKEMMRIVGLDEAYLNHYPKEMSGGQRQRVSIALALMVDPSFIVADEPVSALDVSVQAQILNLLKKLQKEFSLTYLFISHDLNVVSWLSDRIGVMYLGNLVEIGTQEQIAGGAKHPYTQALFAASHAEDEECSEQKSLLSGEVPSPSDPPSGCPFHTRCPYCTERCRAEKPLLKEIAPGWSVACHMQEENNATETI